MTEKIYQVVYDRTDQDKHRRVQVFGHTSNGIKLAFTGTLRECVQKAHAHNVKQKKRGSG